MANIIVEGVPGAGKTFDSVVRFLVPAVAAGRTIYTNIDGINLWRLSELTGRSYEQLRTQIIEVRGARAWKDLLTMDIEDIDAEGARAKKLVQEKYGHLLNSMCLIDESQMIWARSAYREESEGWKGLLAWHRHLRMDIIWITQSTKNLSAYVGEVTERVHSVKNLGFISSIAGRRYVIHVREKPGQPNYTTMHGSYEKKYFGVYKTAVADEQFKLSRPTAVGGVVTGAVLATLLAVGVRLYSHGIMGTPGGLKKRGDNSLALSVAGAVPAQKSVGVGLKDSVADRGFTPLTPGATAQQLAPVLAVVAGLDPKKTCYQIPVRSSWSIRFPNGLAGHAEPEERGWKDTVKNVCY